MKKSFKRVVLPVAMALSLSAGLTACGASDSGETKAPKADGKLSIVATTGYLGDAAKQIAPEADVTVLVGPGGDPHTQELTTKDTEKINSADVVLWTGHDMEHKMMDQLDKLGKKQVPAGEAIPEKMLLPWEEDGKIEGHDPHVWNSPDN
ncbi:MAG: metal ABC transporter substrate-binding protein, partial [Actinomycetaceae bacterium]|nr:metal ABC transporter substrate-binding protein [Actinomycetaceae bacterium]